MVLEWLRVVGVGETQNSLHCGGEATKYYFNRFLLFNPFMKSRLKPFCQIFFKTFSAPLEKPLHQRSRSYS
jgi:hypothetical protein